MKTYKSYAKINLSLEVISKRQDGYHEIDTLMHKIQLHDKLSFNTRPDDELVIRSNRPDLPLDRSNLVYRAWELLCPYRQGPKGMDIYIEKVIPIAAGLGGGTSNGVLTMQVLNKIWDLKLTKTKLIELAKGLGADSTFFFYDKLVRAKGIGDKIVDTINIPTYPIILVSIDKGLSSGQVYSELTDYSSGRVEDFCSSLYKTQLPCQKAYNNMEKVSFAIYPELKAIKAELNQTGSCFSLMSGAGPTIFALYEDSKTRDQAFDQVKDSYPIVLKSRLV